MPRSVFPAISLLFLALGLFMAGCSSPEGAADQLPTHDVTAKVTVDGEPIEQVQLTMTPTEGSNLPNSGAAIGEGGTGKFSTYSPEGGIPAGEYNAGLLHDSLYVKPIPQVKPLKVTITEEMEGGEVAIDFESTGRTKKSPLPPPQQ